jgi:hypothetical protein
LGLALSFPGSYFKWLNLQDEVTYEVPKHEGIRFCDVFLKTGEAQGCWIPEKSDVLKKPDGKAGKTEKMNVVLLGFRTFLFFQV